MSKKGLLVLIGPTRWKGQIKDLVTNRTKGPIVATQLHHLHGVDPRYIDVIFYQGSYKTSIEDEQMTIMASHLDAALKRQ